MQRTQTGSPLAPADMAAIPAFKVVIAYEDFETGKHAKRACDFLAGKLGPDCRFSDQMWKFDVLSIPKLREIAAADASAADIVVISCRSDELPTHVRDWLELWLACPGTPLALVALFDRPPEESPRARALRDYLAEIARRGHMEFFVQPDESPDRPCPGGPLAPDRPPTRNQRALETLAGAVQRNSWPPRA
jgi:hypothetical protein